MKKIFSFLLVLFSLTALSQERYSQWLPAPQTKPWMSFDSTITIPRGTAPSLRGGINRPGAIFFNTTDSSLYNWTGTQWIKAGGTTDTTGLSHRINQKLGIADSASMLSGYPRRNELKDTAAAIRADIGSGGSSYTYKEAIKESGGVVTINNKRDVIITDQTFTAGSLPGTFTAVGSPSYTADASGLHFTGFGSSTFAKYVRTNKATMAEGGEATLYFKVDATTGTDSAFAVGFQSINSNGYTHHVMLEWIADASSPNYGKLHFFGATGSYNLYSDSAKTTYQATDQFALSLFRDGLNYIGKVQNITKGWTVSINAVATSPITPYIPHNTAYPAFYHRGGSFTATRFAYVIHSPVVLDMIIAGNSITLGQGANSPLTRWAANVGIPQNNIIAGGGADVTAQVVATLDEKVALYPRRVMLDIGGNDILFGVSAATWKANLVTIYNTLTAAGIDVIFKYPNPRTATDISALKTYLDTCNVFNLAYKIKTPWTQLLGSGTSLLTIYDADGTHPNTAGHQYIAYLVNVALNFPVSLAIQNQSSASQANATFWMSGLGRTDGRFQGTTSGAGNGDNTGAFVGMGASGTSKVQIGLDVTGTPYGWISSITPGTAYRHIVINPGITTAYLGVQITAPTAALHVQNSDANTTTIARFNHQGSFSAQNQKLIMAMQNAGVDRTAWAAYAGPGNQMGSKFYTTLTTTMNTDPNLTLAGSRLNGVGLSETTDPTAVWHIAASSTAGASLRIPTGTAPSSPNEGDIWTASNFLKYYNGSATRRIPGINDATPSNGQLAIGNGTDFTVASITSTGNTITVTPGAGTLNIDIPTTLLTSGTYTPTASGATGGTVVSVEKFVYQRSGSVVSFSGYVSIDPTADGSIMQFFLTLPVASNFAGDYDASGTLGCVVAGSVGQFHSDATQDKILVSFVGGTGSTAGLGIRITGQYEIL